ncbi:glycine betaine/L-proline ABC transporter ATP-binding protein [Sphingobacterium phlebotomi]|uniref:Glycine betaine/L-proline ABC transporter ATP-binding protein n=1 Tax=Sphingobacterium phlebotomi TaxID=2605433 RepID=A0A5D4H4L2_9SPHI|nr:glycine betaine/L-proline ABC transporter ATP-binding protein [Sphingobacterium phlebotomi]TYR35756.1 glycine betaine/L-proline ABC transporter ATP-binding protein [Sphingobacterium phlebotomi]
MDENRPVKIKIKDLVLIFGKKKEKALQILKQGKNKKEILEATQCSVGVNGASFEIFENEFFVIMGLSGSGKSTLLRCLNRLIEPTAGSIYINDDDITRKTHKELLDVRRTEMSMVFQKFGLLPHRTIIENVAFGLEIRGEDAETRKEKAQNALDTVGLRGLENQYPSQLSGGMQQRVGLARALTNSPEVLLMDEAFSALDPLIKTEMQDELLALQEKLKKTIVFITHDLDEAIKLGDRIAIMKDGVIEQIGSAEEILTNPATEYVEAFVKKVDRKTIITAGTLMHAKPTVVRLGKDGPEGTLRKMRATGLDVLPVVNDQQAFMGFVWVKDAVQCAKEKEKTIHKILLSDVPAVTTEVTVEEMLPLISATRSPIAVVNGDEKRLLGIVTQNSLIIEATRFDAQDIQDLKEQANNS